MNPLDPRVLLSQARLQHPVEKAKNNQSSDIIAKTKITSPTTQTEPERVWRPSQEKSERVTNAAFGNVVNSNTPENTAYYLWSRGQMQSKKPLSEALQDNEDLPLDLAVGPDQDDLLQSLLGIEEKQTMQPSTDLEGFYSKCLVQAKKENMIGEQILYLLKLTGIYIGKAKAEKEQVKKENFLIVGAKILNCALILVPHENTLLQNYLFKRLEEIEKLFLECQGVKTTIKEGAIQNARKRLNDIRKTAQDSHENGKSIQKILFSMTQDFIRLLKDLISQTQKLLPPAPVKWAAMGMGSMSRDEMCPYSDVEFAFLVEENSQKAMDYFRMLSQILELRIINLGETKFPIFGNSYPSPTPDGFCMDAGGNTPLGVTGVYELIGTPKMLAEFQKIQWMDRSIILSNAMSHVCFISGTESLVADYNKKKKKVQELIDIEARSKEKNSVVLSTRLLAGHIEEFSPNLSKEKEKTSAFGIKKELYRPFQEIIASLALVYQLKSKTTFKRIDELVSLGVFYYVGAKNLKNAITQVLTLRLKAHLFYQNEEEFLCHPEVGKPLDPHLMYFDEETLKTLQKIYQILIPFHHCAQLFLTTQSKKAFFSLFRDNSSVDKGEIFYKDLEYTKAQQAHQEAVALNPNDVTVLFNLGVIENMMGKSQDALPRFFKALELAQKEYGENHPTVATSYEGIGNVYYRLGEYENMLEYYQKSLKIRLEVLGENHSDVAKSYNGIGAVYDCLKEYEKALEYFQKSLKINLQVLGENHRNVAQNYNNIGSVYDSLKEYEKALKPYQKSLNIRLQLFDENHPDVATSYTNIGSAYNCLGDYRKALEHYQKALKIMLQVLGENHPDLAQSYNNIGLVYNSLGEYEKALEYYQKDLKILLQVLGENHPDVAGRYNGIGNVYKNLREYEKALEHYQKYLTIKLQVLGENHPDVARSYNNIGAVYYRRGENEKALEYYQKDLKISLQVLGESHPDIATSYNGIGGVYYSLKEYVKALEYYQKSLKITLQVFGENHPDAALRYNNIGLVYKSLEEYEKAIDYYRQSLELRCKIYKKSCPEILNTLKGLILVAKNLPVFERTPLKQTYAICVETLGANHELVKELLPLIT